MAEDHLEVRMPVKYTSQDNAYELDTGFVMPSETKSRQSQINRCAKPCVVGIADACPGNLRVDQQWDVQLSRASESRLENRVIEILIADAAIENGALATELLDTAPKLSRGIFTIRERQYRQCLKAGGVCGDGFGQEVIDAARQIDAVMPQVVEARGRQRENLHVDAGFVHQRQPLLGEIGQTLAELARIQRKCSIVSAGDRVPRLFHRIG
ncbi:hypothetical protein UW163_10520 [Ralstonia solanacearum]|nr:hypothetical protein UW163_10520 [Ralstonia solanacearum]